MIRGKYLLSNFLGTPPPTPPEDLVVDLAEAGESTPPSIRERLEQHRESPVCFSCHAVIDPPGFALENFDAIGGWRTTDESGNPNRCRRDHAERHGDSGVGGPAGIPAR